MRLTTIRVQNFRSFKDKTIDFDPYTCLIGTNGVGKSNVLRAVGVFFREPLTFAGETGVLLGEDFHCGDTSESVRITLTFGDLSDEAKEDFSDYVRLEQLVVSAVATWDPASETAPVVQRGSRLGMSEFRVYFAQDSEGKKAADLKETYGLLRAEYLDLPDVKQKAGMAAALRAYEAEHHDQCTELESNDQFYGFSKGANRLAKYLQFVYVPAVKDASSEELESRNSVLGALVQRAVRSTVSFTDELSEMTLGVREQYDELLRSKDEALDKLSKALTERIREWATPDTALALQWRSTTRDPLKIAEPAAKVVATQGGFEGELGRMGHGMQRSFLLALLQVLAAEDVDTNPTLLFACEEPELYQHPPQIRHLASVLKTLSDGNAQVLLCTHSPLLVTGVDFEGVRMTRRSEMETTVTWTTVTAVSEAIGKARSEEPKKLPGRLAKLHQCLQPSLSEMFFCDRLVLVEGHEDRAFILAWMELSGRWDEFRRRGIHVVPTEGKSSMIQPRAVATLLGIPTFTIFDGDSHAKEEHWPMHQADNRALLSLCGHDEDPALPSPALWKDNCVMWGEDIGKAVSGCLDHDAFERVRQATLAGFGGDTKNLKKDTLFICTLLEDLEKAELIPSVLEDLCNAIMNHFA